MDGVGKTANVITRYGRKIMRRDKSILGWVGIVLCRGGLTNGRNTDSSVGCCKSIDVVIAV